MDQVGAWDVYVLPNAVWALNKDAERITDLREFTLKQARLRFPRIAEQLMAVRGMLLGKVGDNDNWGD